MEKRKKYVLTGDVPDTFDERFEQIVQLEAKDYMIYEILIKILAELKK